MEMKSNMVVEEIKTGDLYLLDGFTAGPGQYNTGTTWVAKEILNDITYEDDGEFDFTGTTRHVDSVTHAEDFQFIAMAHPEITWKFDTKATESMRQEHDEKAVKEALSKLSKEQQKLLSNYFRSR